MSILLFSKVTLLGRVETIYTLFGIYQVVNPPYNYTVHYAGNVLTGIVFLTCNMLGYTFNTYYIFHALFKN